MALAETGLPYGMRDCKVTPYTDAAGTILAVASVDLPNGRTFSYSEAEDFEELRGDDKVVAKRGKGGTVNWELESGGISFAAAKSMNGGEILETGVTPNVVRTYRKRETDQKPWFKIEGQSLSESGGDFHSVVYKCKADGDWKGSQGDGVFYLTQASGSAIGATIAAEPELDGVLYDQIMNETITPIE